MRIVVPAIMAMATLLVATAHGQEASTPPERVTFPSADGHTKLVGYVFMPIHKEGVRMPAVVLMHGRAGAYSILAKGRYDASTLTQRHQMWSLLWSAQGFIALMVDGFGPRGYPAGFPRGSYGDRPNDINEVTVRPLDAYGALAWLRKRPDVLGDRIALQGWSNGGSATLATMAAGVATTPASVKGFTAAIAYYPACGLKGQFEDGYRPYAPVRVFHGTEDEEVSYELCQKLVEKSRAQGAGDIDIKVYAGATHDFDDPGRKRQSVKANARAMTDSMARAQHFLGQQLRDHPPVR
jgi:carboxymethylenebutenolidase